MNRTKMSFQNFFVFFSRSSTIIRRDFGISVTYRPMFDFLVGPAVGTTLSREGQQQIKRKN